MAHRTASCALLLAVLAASASSGAAIESFFGYQEGTRRNVTCLDGGYFRGMEVYMGHEGAYKEAFVTGVRLLCTSFHLDIEYWGTRNDSFMFGLKGKSENPADVEQAAKTEAICPDGAGISWLEWREAAFFEGQAGELRIGGFTLKCSDGSRRVVDPGQGEQAAHPHSDGCKQAGAKLAAVEMWFWGDNFSGLTPIRCA